MSIILVILALNEDEVLFFGTVTGFSFCSLLLYSSRMPLRNMLKLFCFHGDFIDGTINDSKRCIFGAAR